MDKTPVVILNGFLGSGKTTLFRSLLVQSKKKDLAVSAIVNDMSELDVDGELIGNSDMMEDNPELFVTINSCVISSKKGIQKLDKALHKFIANGPKLIIIETSGSAHPMPLVQYFKKQSKFRLTGILALVDSLMLAHDYNYGQKLIPLMQQNLQLQKRGMINLLVEQILFCSHLIITKADRIPKEKLSEVAKQIQPINPFVSIFSVLFGKLAIEDLLEMQDYDFYKVAQLIDELQPTLQAESEENRPYNMATRVLKDDRPFHPERLWNVCHQYLDQRIYRSKGFFWLASRDSMSLLWNQTAGSINLELMGYWRSGMIEENSYGLLEEEIVQLKAKVAEDSGRFGDRHCHITIIGDKNQVDKFTNELNSCFLTEDEIQYWEIGGEFDDPWPANIVKIT